MTYYSWPDQQPVRLGRRLGGGGEGEVHALATRPSRAVKIYHADKQLEKAPKITAMVAQGMAARTRLVSFPETLVVDPSGAVVGFIMRGVTGHRTMIDLYNPPARRKFFPQADYRFLVRAATNVARAVATVHYANYIVGDLNESGLLVSDTALVAMIDADSFELEANGRRFLCSVGKDDYTAPEFPLSEFGRRERTRNHDAFGLAVMIFHLLFLGREPFAGIGPKGDLELRASTEQHCFAYSRDRDTGVRPPPGTVLLSDMSPIVAAQFESAFQPVGRVGLRPRARDWVDSLERFEQELVACPRVARHHHHPAAGACPWCRIEAEVGLDPF